MLIEYNGPFLLMDHLPGLLSLAFPDSNKPAHDVVKATRKLHLDQNWYQSRICNYFHYSLVQGHLVTAMELVKPHKMHCVIKILSQF